MFEAGAAEGKSEEEISLSLGEPKRAAASLLSEQTYGERISKLAEMWLPLIISVVLYGVYVYCGYQGATDNYRNYVLPIMYVLPLIIWVLFEHKGFFTALADYKCDFSTFLGSLCIIAASASCNQMPKMAFTMEYSNLQKYSVVMAAFVSLAMIFLAVSLYKNAPKLFAAVPFIGIISIIYESVQLCRAYSIWNGDKNDIYSGAASVGGILSNILNIIFICATAFLIWSFIYRNALSLASAYCAMTVTGFMFYWYYNLSAIDPTDSNSLYFIKYITTGKNYLIWGTIIAAAVLVMTIIVKLAKLINRKRGG